MDGIWRACAVLRDHPHVVGVGVGWKETRGALTGAAALRVYVTRKLAAEQLARDDRIPGCIAGWRTDVVPALAAIATSGDDSLAPLEPGVVISNLRGIRGGEAAPGVLGLGTLGCLALDHRVRTRREVVLVSSRHVLLAHGAGRGDPIYRPSTVRRGGVDVVSHDDAIAEISDEGAEANHRFAYPGEAAADYFVDCAAARLREPGRVRSPVRGVVRLHPLDVVGGRAPRVRKLGGTSGTTTGRVIDVSAPVRCGEQQRARNLVIRSASGRFVEPGDSGALLVDDRDRAVGLLWGRSDQDPALAYACHIHPVLDCLQLTLMTRGLV